MICILHGLPPPPFEFDMSNHFFLNLVAMNSPNSSANLKLTILLYKRKNMVFVFSKCLKKEKLP